MRTTLTLDDGLFARAMALAPKGTDKAALLREAVQLYTQVMAGRRLAALGGTVPGMNEIPRRKPASTRGKP